MKKILALVLAALMVFAIVACGSSTPAANTDNSSNTPAKTETDTQKAETPAESKTYQFVGVYEEAGANASMLNAAFLLNLNADGTAVADRYQFSQFNAAPAAENSSYQASYMSGTWKEVEKDGVPALQIKLAYVDEAGNESSASTNYAYEIAGEYSFDLSFPIVPGMSYSRIAPMAGSETKVYADADSFIAAFKQDFVAPEHIAAFVGEGATAYLTEDGKVLIYLGVDKNAEGKWSNDGALAISINDADQELKIDGNKASFVYSVDRGDGNMVDFELACDDISVLGAPAVAEVAADAPYDGGNIDLGGNPYPATLTLNDDGSAELKVAMGMNVKYERLGNVVILFQDENAPLEGYGATIFGIVPNAWIVDDETKTMTGLKVAYFWLGEGAQLTFTSVDGETMTIGLPAYGMSGDGYGFEVSEDGSTLTLTAPESWEGAWGNVWEQMGKPITWAIDGIHVNPAA